MTRDATGDVMRTSHRVGGRLVAIDSWYDIQRGTWCAAGASHPMLAFARPRAVPAHCSSRDKAIGQLLWRFGRHFGPVCQCAGRAVARPAAVTMGALWRHLFAEGE